MSDHQLKVHVVEYLSVSNAKIGNPPNERPIVIITIRPDEGSVRPHNLAIARSQAERLFEDLKSIMSHSAVWILLLAMAGLAGCSAQVEVEEEMTCSRAEATDQPEARPLVTQERSRTAVAVDLLRDPRNTALPSSPHCPFWGALRFR